MTYWRPHRIETEEEIKRTSLKSLTTEILGVEAHTLQNTMPFMYSLIRVHNSHQVG